MNRKRLSPAPWQPSYERGAHAKRLNALYKRLHALLLHRRRYRSVTIAVVAFFDLGQKALKVNTKALLLQL